MVAHEEPAGATDVEAMLASLSVIRRPGEYTVSTLATAPAAGEGVEVILAEAEAWTVVAERAVADARGWPYGFVAAWLTLEVHSSLEAVGLTAAFSAALGSAGISCNVLAGYFHDHLLVPVDRADDALAALHGLRGR